MPASTTKGISYPLGPDKYAATPAFAALAATTDQAIRSSETTVLATAKADMTKIAGDTEARVENMIAASALAGMDQAAVDAAVTRVLGSSAWRERQALSVTPEDFGAKGDGVTDDTAAIQSAINNPNGAQVEFSAGKTYRVTSTLQVPSGAELRGNGATLRSSTFMNTAIHVAGSVGGPDINLVGSYNAGDTNLKTATPHGLVVGETFRLVGQRVAASIDAPTEDRLGMATGDSGKPWFGEYLTVREVISDTEIQVSTGLLFNGYRDNKNQETHSGARARTTLNKITWNARTRIEGFHVEIPSMYTVKLEFAMDAVIKDITEVRQNDYGYVVGTLGSYRCLTYGVHCTYPRSKPESVDYYARNSFKIMNSQSVVLDSCTCDGGGQIVDLTYQGSHMIPTIACTIRNCTFIGWDDNAITSHPGVWGTMIHGNDFRRGNDARQVSCIGIRSPYSIIANNTMRGQYRDGGYNTGEFQTLGNYGIHFYDGGGHHSQVIGNQIRGYAYGIGHSDGNEPAERHGEISILIAGNSIDDAVTGIRTVRSPSNTYTNLSNFVVSGNQITSKLRDATGVHLNNATGAMRMPVVIGNTMHFTGANPTPVRVGAATRDTVLSGNVVTGTATFLWSHTGTQKIHESNNLVVAPSGPIYYPPRGTTGVVSVSAASVSGSVRVGAEGSTTAQVAATDSAGALTGSTRTWVESLVSNAANLNEALRTAQDAQTAAGRAEQLAGAAQTTATEAKSAAGTAQTTADTAQTAAGAAQSTASTAKSTADGLVPRVSAVEARTLDTGWRDVTSLVVPDRVSGRVMLRRSGAMCRLVFDSLVFSASGSGNMLVLPPGFRPSFTESNTVQGLSLRGQVTIYGNVQGFGWASASQINGSLGYFTDNVFPASTDYPGTPA